MAETVHIPIPDDDWIELSALAATLNGRVSNSGNATLVYVQAIEKPDADSNSGHRIDDDRIFDYVVKAPEALWMRALHSDGIASVTPDLAVGVLDGALDVHQADVHRIPVNDFFHRHTGTQTALATATVSGDIQLDVPDSTGFVIGDLVHLGATNEYIEPRHPIVTGVPDINTVVLDGPIHTEFPIGTPVIKAIANMASQNGTLAAPASYRYFPGVNRVEHATRILISMTHSSAGTDDLFGGITALLNGMHFRSSISGQFGTFTNWKSNSDIKLDMYDVEYSVKSGSSNFGTNGRGSFSRIGVVVRLDSEQSDFLEILVQDTVIGSGLADLRIKVQGHVEGR